MVSPEQPEDSNYDAADPDQSTHDGAGLNEHGPLKSGFQAGQFGAWRLRGHVLTMLGGLADGVRQPVGLGSSMPASVN